MASGHVAQQAGIPPEAMAKASLVGMYTVGFPLTPLTPSFFLLVGLAGVNIGAHTPHASLGVAGEHSDVDLCHNPRSDSFPHLARSV